MKKALLSNDKRPKPESKLAAQAARTRKRLIEATLELLPRHSFHTLSLDAIAAHVGMTKGAIYGSFPNKYALIGEALGSLPDLRPDRLAWPKGREGTPRERMRRLGEAVLASLGTSSAYAPASIELVLHMLTDEEGRKLRRQIGLEMRSRIEERLGELFAPDELTAPARSVSLAISLLVPGLMFARAYEGGEIDDETVLGMFEGFAASPPAPRRKR
jgi:AcrR family transcriptional regulator